MKKLLWAFMSIGVSDLLAKCSESHPVIKETKKWGKIICVWDEVKNDGQNLHHIYSATINLNNGDLYLDCRRRKIWAKCAVLTIGQPIKIAIKTGYHLSMIPVAKEIFKTLKGKQTKKELCINCAKSLADTVRTPLYGVALTITSLAAMIAIPFRPNLAYDFREAYGKIEQSLHWGVKHDKGTLSLCFQPIFNIDSNKSHYAMDKNYADTEYPEILDPESEMLHRRLANYSRSLILFRRNHRNLFNDRMKKLDSSIAYKSMNLSRLDPKGT